MEKTNDEAVFRAWGAYMVIEEGPNYKIKELIVKPNHCLSYQKHFSRSEFWFVKSGHGTAIVGDTVIELYPGKCVNIDVEKWHQLINGSNHELVIHEIQYGVECSELDIERK